MQIFQTKLFYEKYPQLPGIQANEKEATQLIEQSMNDFLTTLDPNAIVSINFAVARAGITSLICYQTRDETPPGP